MVIRVPGPERGGGLREGVAPGPGPGGIGSGGFAGVFGRVRGGSGPETPFEQRGWPGWGDRQALSRLKARLPYTQPSGGILYTV